MMILRDDDDDEHSGDNREYFSGFIPVEEKLQQTFGNQQHGIGNRKLWQIRTW
jgi:hypothetical protein